MRVAQVLRRIQKLEVTQGRMSLAFQSVAPGDYFQLAPDCVLNADHGVHLEYKCGSIEQNL